MTFPDLTRGEWCRRKRAKATWHVVESQIDDRAVTRCGRQMAEHDAAGHELETVYAEPTQWGDLLCLVCLG